MSGEYSEFKAKTVEDAIIAGITELGLPLEEVEYEVVSEGKGIFGLGRNAVIKMRPRKEGESAGPAGLPDRKSEAKAEKKAEKKAFNKKKWITLGVRSNG